MNQPEYPTETDVVVVGSGAAGFVCALTAAVGGIRVVIVEKSDRLGGTSAMSGGAVWVPANRHGRKAGAADSPAEALAICARPRRRVGRKPKTPYGSTRPIPVRW